jgi:hypothetical protein
VGTDQVGIAFALSGCMAHQPFWKPLVRAAQRVADRSPKRESEPGERISLPGSDSKEPGWPAFPMRHSDAGKPMQPRPRPIVRDEPSVLDLPIG